MKIHLADSKDWERIGEKFTKRYKAEVRRAYKDASKLLPFGSKQLNFFVQPNSYGVIPETGSGGKTINSELVMLVFDPKLALGEEVILKSTRATVFHEMNHAARWHKSIWHTSALDMCLFEGLATVFEREHAMAKPLWGDYDQSLIRGWLKEVSGLPDGVLRDDYYFNHPDGRRWIAYKVGTYIIDEAIKHSGKTVVELTQMECADILKLAKINPSIFSK